MSRRVSHSLLDPLISPLVPKLYAALNLPRRLPPEAIVISGHVIAIIGAVGFALSTKYWWGGLLIAAGVAGNHLCDMIDGTHARRTGQCRNGGELLDHFIDPLSFSYWMIGLAVGCGRLDLALAAVLFIYAQAVLTSIKAKLIGEFTLAHIGPTEFKALLTLYGLGLAVLHATPLVNATPPALVAQTFLWILVIIGVSSLLINLVCAVREVNARGKAPDTSEWQIRSNQADAPRDRRDPGISITSKDLPPLLRAVDG